MGFIQSTLKQLRFFFFVLPAVMLGSFLVAIRNFWISKVYLQDGDHIMEPADLVLYQMRDYWVPVHLELAGELTQAEVKNLLLDRLMNERNNHSADKFYKLHSVVVEDHGIAFWRNDKNFDISNNVKLHPEVAENEEHLNRIIAQSLSTSQPETHSPWYVIMIHTKEGNTVLLFLVIHFMTDGLGAVNLVNELLADTPGETPQSRSSLQQSLYDRMCFWWQCIFQKKANFPHQKEFHMFRPEHERKEGMLKWSKPLMLSDMQAIRRSFPNSTLNDILCGVIMYSVIQVVNLRGFKSGHVSLSVPVSLRSAKQKLELTNISSIFGHVASVSPDVPLSDHILQFSKTSSQAKTLTPYMWFHFGNHVVQAATLWRNGLAFLFSLMGYAASMAISNMAGPKKEIKILGKEVRNMGVFPVYCKGEGLVITISGYNGKAAVCFTDKSGIMTDSEADYLLQRISENFNGLLEKVPKSS